MGGYYQDSPVVNVIQETKKQDTKVHAELLVLDYFDRHSTVLFHGYIGSSKPPCFLCYLYLKHHPRCYALPDTSNNLYLQWRMPDINRSVLPNSSDESNRSNNSCCSPKERFKAQITILQKMREDLRDILLAELAETQTRAGRWVRQHDDSSVDRTSSGVPWIFAHEKDQGRLEDDILKDELASRFRGLMFHRDGEPSSSTRAPSEYVYAESLVSQHNASGNATNDDNNDDDNDGGGVHLGRASRTLSKVKPGLDSTTFNVFDVDNDNDDDGEVVFSGRGKR